MPGRHRVDHAVERKIGQRLRQYRRARVFSQTELGAAVGLTFQQIQKYESGANRISASTLYAFSRALGVSVEELLDVEIHEPTYTELAEEREIMAAARVFVSVPKFVRQAWMHLLRSVVDGGEQRGDASVEAGAVG